MSTGSVSDCLRRNLAAVRERIEAARRRSAHAADDVTLLPVTKAVPPALFPALAAAGVTRVGENRVQQVAQRRPDAPAGWIWHGIGHLQRNKAAEALRLFDVFHALDSIRLAERLSSLLARGARGGAAPWPVYLQVNAARDPAKSGVTPEEAPAFVAAVDVLPHLAVQGFMTMARAGGSEADVRATFRTLRGVRDEAVRRGVGSHPPRGLSMGMSDDFDLAVEEGATIVRVGRAIYDGISLETAAAAAPQTAEIPTPQDEDDA